MSMKAAGILETIEKNELPYIAAEALHIMTGIAALQGEGPGPQRLADRAGTNMMGQRAG